MNELIRICKEIRQYNLPTAESRNRSVSPTTAERIPSCYKNRKIIPMTASGEIKFSKGNYDRPKDTARNPTHSVPVENKSQIIAINSRISYF